MIFCESPKRTERLRSYEAPTDAQELPTQTSVAILPDGGVGAMRSVGKIRGWSHSQSAWPHALAQLLLVTLARPAGDEVLQEVKDS